MSIQLALTRLNTTELYEYASQVQAIALQQGPTEVAKSPLYVALTAVFGKYDEGFKKDGKSMLTDPIEVLDIDRDRLVKWAYYTILGLSFSSDASAVEAATLLLSKFDTYGLELIRLSYSEESASIKGLLNDLKRSDYASAVTKVNIQPILTELEQVQNEFDKKFEQRREQKDERSNIEAAFALRRELEAAIRQLRTLVQGMAMAVPTSEWAKVDGLYNQLDSEYAQKLRTKATLRAKQKEEAKK